MSTPLTPTRTASATPPMLLNSTLRVDVLGFAVAALMSVAGYLVVVQPVRQEAERRDQARAQTEEAVRKATTAAGHLEESRKRLSRIETELESVAVQLLPSTRINQQIDRLTGLAERHALKLSQMGPEKSERSKWFTAVPIRMDGAGSYLSFRSFLSAVSNEFPDVTVKGLRLNSPADIAQRATRQPPNTGTGAENNAANAVADATFEIEFVWYAAPEGSAAADEPANR